MAVIKSISLAARVVMDMHALNNEGNESNRLMTRQVGIVTPVYGDDHEMAGYNRAVVNAISGDMNKHMFADAFRHIALEHELHLCKACQALDPARMMGNPDFRAYLGAQEESYEQAKKNKDSERMAEIIKEIINRLLECAVDDVCGIMITEGVPIKRKSAIEFGWTVGLPEITEVQEFIHARHAITRLTRIKGDRGDNEAEKEQVRREKEANIGQMIFNRPASSGVYAFVAHLDACAIGFNDASQEYTVSQEERGVRLRAALLALTQTVLHPKGALTSTQLPHVVDVEGFVSVSQSAAAAPLISPLMDNFIERGAGVADLTNRLHGEGAVYTVPFNGAEQMLSCFVDALDSSAPGKYRG
jgi:CRISPR-associated protein Cst2